MRKITALPVSHGVMTLAAVFMTWSVIPSCTPRKTITEQIVVHDTLHTFHSDTIRLSTHRSRTDTVRENTVRVITLRQDSAHTDTVRVETLRERWHMVYVTDTAHFYRHLADSLQAVKNRQTVKKQSVKRNITVKWWLVAVLISVVVLTLLRRFKAK